MGGSAENPILLDEEEDKENSPQLQQQEQQSLRHQHDSLIC